MTQADAACPGLLPRAELPRLLAALRGRGLQVLGPCVQDGAVVYAPLTGVGQLPWGQGDQQAPGSYRVHAQAPAQRAFAWANGPQALKPLTFAPQEHLWRVQRDATGALGFEAVEPTVEATAVLGVRACDLAALRLQTQHFLESGLQDGPFARRRAALFLVAVNCSHPAQTCFCASTGDGPGVPAGAGADLILDELDEGYRVRADSAAGRALLAELALRPATASETAAAQAQLAAAAEVQTRRLDAAVARDALAGAHGHPHWAEVAERCLACGNCTAVCPSCFCHAEREEPALDLASSEHHREWDSCFTAGHSSIHGLLVRADTASRYRQWLTHKLSGWWQQYGRSGCVGCGRCISWCPVGIDLTVEVAAFTPSGQGQ